MINFKVGDLVNVRLSHSRVMTGLIIESKECPDQRRTTFVVHNAKDSRTAHAWEIDMEMISESR